MEFKAESILGKILAYRQDLSREQLLELVRKKKEETRHLLNDEGAAFLVASDLGVPLLGGSLKTNLQIKDVIPSLNDVTVSGRILAVYPVVEFTRPDGSRGKVRRLTICDRTATLDVLLWNEKAYDSIVGELKVNRIVRFAHGYSRVSITGETELHIGSRGELTLSPPDEADSMYPRLDDLFERIAQLDSRKDVVNISGVVERIYPVKTFEKQEEVGRVVKATMRDGSGRVNIVAWNDDVELVECLKPGEEIQILKGKVRRNITGEIEVHINRKSQIIKKS
ncbi:MAG: OB-fold nucleic acid binding domain-containing protein [Candidatus Bathyarchaeia archaeon]